MAEEVAAVIATRVAVIGGFGVGVVRNHECVVVLGLARVCCDDWGRVLHSLANFGQGVLLEILLILLLFVDRLKSLLHRFIVLAGILVALRKETLAGQRVEHLAIVRGSGYKASLKC